MSLWFTIAFTYIALLLLAALLYWVFVGNKPKQFLQGAALSFIPMVFIMLWDMWT